MDTDTKSQKIQAFNERQQNKQTQKANTSQVLGVTVPAAPKDVPTDTQIKAIASQDKATRDKQAQLEKQQKQELEQQQQATQDALGLGGQAAGAIQESIDTQVNRGKQVLQSVPTPGGIMTLLLILGFFLLAIVPVDNNGNTRLKLIWLTLTGGTHMSYSNLPSKGASGDFSTPALTDVTPVAGAAKPSAGIGGYTNGSAPSVPLGDLQQVDIMSFLMGEQ